MDHIISERQLMNDTLGDRRKNYEGQESDRRFMPLLPICARLDGRGFHNFTKGMQRPYDPYFSRLMIDTTKYLVEETNAKIGYTQSDEISLIFYSDKYESQVFFDGRTQKMNSILASMCSVYFNKMLIKTLDQVYLDNINNSKIVRLWIEKLKSMPLFDCRVWTVPNQEEACNVLLWRELDSTKNAITMAAREYYSDKELFKKNGSEKQELLHKKGVNFNDYPAFFKCGSYLQRRTTLKKFTIEELVELPAKHEARKNPDLKVERSEVSYIEMPIFSKVINRVGVVFNGENPKEIKNAN
jgi:tRNA(His) 5'-end guanylyltransferase